MKILVFVTLTFLFATVTASGTEVTFHDGVVVLQNGEIISGKIAVTSFQLALVEIADKRNVYAAHQVDKILFYDAGNNINRKFVSVESEITNGYSFYEKILVGEASVLRRPKLSVWQTSKITVWDHEQFEYYVLWQERVIPVNQVKKTFFDTWDDMLNAELSAYVKNQHLSLYNTADVIHLVQHYNKRIKRKPLLAGL